MCLLFLLNRLEYQVIVGHVNYKLRGDQADLDEELVTNYCKELGIPLFKYSCSKEESMDLKSGNLQEKARLIRQSFFERILQKEDVAFICTAHHADDRLETSMLNLMRGSGITGLTSLGSKNGQRIRPLIFASKRDITHCIEDHRIPFRTDLSNLESYYDRNYIRNEVFPVVEKRFSGYRSGLLNTLSILEDEKKLIDHTIATMKETYFTSSEKGHQIAHLERLREIPGYRSLTWKWLSTYGFNRNQVESMMAKDTKTGSVFHAKKFRAVRDRNGISIRLFALAMDARKIVDSFGTFQMNDVALSVSVSTTPDINDDPNHEFVDRGKVDFPLYMRFWEPGDVIMPIGMTGSKKVSDLLTNLKLDRFEKEEVTVLLNSDRRVIWVMGHRISEEFKVEKDSKEVIELHLGPLIPSE